jgi:ATP-citrate lyase alpha-subunit
LEEVATTFSTQDHFLLAKSVETLTLEKKPSLILNVDGHIAAMMLDILVDIGLPNNEIEQYITAGLFNGIFVLSRSIGFIGHYLDQQRLQE